VYVTSIAPRSRKGPHLHNVRTGRFACIIGEVRIQVRLKDGAHDGFMIKPGSSLAVIPPGFPCALYNYGDTEALVINMPNPAWSKENPDDHPVMDWQDPADWPPAPTKHVHLYCGTGGPCTICGGGIYVEHPDHAKC
jgi:mannose-6-phosphate isomerase-like protein (cupin superfamily)